MARARIRLTPLKFPDTIPRAFSPRNDRMYRPTALLPPSRATQSRLLLARRTDHRRSMPRIVYKTHTCLMTRTLSPTHSNVLDPAALVSYAYKIYQRLLRPRTNAAAAKMMKAVLYLHEPWQSRPPISIVSWPNTTKPSPKLKLRWSLEDELRTQPRELRLLHLQLPREIHE